MAVMASSTSFPMVGCGALSLRTDHRPSLGTQKMFSARYSSGSSGSAPSALSPINSVRFASKASEMYLRNMSPRTTCLYSAASILLRRASAAAQSFASRPSIADEEFSVTESAIGFLLVRVDGINKPLCLSGGDHWRYARAHHGNRASYLT